MKLASVVSLIVAIAEVLVLILDAFVAILAALVLMLDSTSDMFPNVKVPSISASLRIVTVPEV